MYVYSSLYNVATPKSHDIYIFAKTVFALFLTENEEVCHNVQYHATVCSDTS